MIMNNYNYIRKEYINRRLEEIPVETRFYIDHFSHIEDFGFINNKVVELGEEKKKLLKELNNL